MMATGGIMAAPALSRPLGASGGAGEEPGGFWGADPVDWSSPWRFSPGAAPFGGGYLGGDGGCWRIVDKSACHGRLAAEGVWWAWWPELLLCPGGGRRRWQVRGQGSTGLGPGRCSGTRPWFPSVRRDLDAAHKALMAMVLLVPLDSCSPASRCSGGGGVRRVRWWWMMNSSPRDLVVFTVLFGVFCECWWISCFQRICGVVHLRVLVRVLALLVSI